MAPDQWKSGALPASSNHNLEVGSPRAKLFDLLRSHFRRCAQPKTYYFAGKSLPKVRDVRIVRVQDCCAIRGQSLDELSLSRSYLRQRLEELQVHRRYCCHNTDAGLCNRCQGAYFASVRHSHLDHRNIVLWFEPQQHQRESELIV